MWETWTELSTHGLVLVALARRPDLRIREIAARVGITERAAQGIVNDLVDAGYVTRLRRGRRNHYVVHGERALRHPATAHREVADLVRALAPGPLVKPTQTSCAAVVLSCSDFRYQEPLQELLAGEGLLGRCEVVLWPGGAAALTSRHGSIVLERLQSVVMERMPDRLLLVSHHGCEEPGAFGQRRGGSLSMGRATIRRQRRWIGRIRARLGMDPESWFLHERGASRVPVGGGRGRSPAPGDGPGADRASREREAS